MLGQAGNVRRLAEHALLRDVAAGVDGAVGEVGRADRPAERREVLPGWRPERLPPERACRPWPAESTQRLRWRLLQQAEAAGLQGVAGSRAEAMTEKRSAGGGVDKEINES